MSEDKLTPFEWIKILAIFAAVVTVYQVVSGWVLRAFWTLVWKLFSKATAK